MKAQKINRWVGIAANVGVVIGLMTLIYELSQNRHLLRAELGTGTIEYQRDLEILKMDDELSEALSFAIHSPEELSDQQMIRLDAYLEAYVLKLYREEYLIQMEVFPDDPAYIIKSAALSAMQNVVARTWWMERRKTLVEDPYGLRFVALMDEALEQTSANGDLQRMNRWRADIQKYEETIEGQ